MLMFSMRRLLSSDPFLPREAREAIADLSEEAHDHLLSLGVDACEAAELLDAPCEALLAD
jgi:hypothetical protein